MSDHTPVMFNVSEDWNEESVVAHLFLFHLQLIIDYWVYITVKQYVWPLRFEIWFES